MSAATLNWGRDSATRLPLPTPCLASRGCPPPLNTRIDHPDGMARWPHVRYRVTRARRGPRAPLVRRTGARTSPSPGSGRVRRGAGVSDHRGVPGTLVRRPHRRMDPFPDRQTALHHNQHHVGAVTGATATSASTSTNTWNRPPTSTSSSAESTATPPASSGADHAAGQALWGARRTARSGRHMQCARTAPVPAVAAGANNRYSDSPQGPARRYW